MIQRYSLVLCLICAPMVLQAGCNTTSSTAPTTATAGDETAKLEAILTDYEAMRAALATDRLDDVPALAGKLETSAKAAQPNASTSVAQPIAAILRDVPALKKRRRTGRGPSTLR